jgi:hypothetical protein
MKVELEHVRSTLETGHPCCTAISLLCAVVSRDLLCATDGAAIYAALYRYNLNFLVRWELHQPPSRFP